MPSRTTIIEWVKCLISPKYAENTYLRITSEEEKKAIAIINIIIAVLVLLCIRQTVLLVDKIQTNNRINQFNEYHKTHPIKNTEFNII